MNNHSAAGVVLASKNISIAISPDGQLRPLVPGAFVNLNDLIITGQNANIKLVLANGETIVKLGNEFFKIAFEMNPEALAQTQSQLEAFSEAVLAQTNPFELLNSGLPTELNNEGSLARFASHLSVFSFGGPMSRISSMIDEEALSDYFDHLQESRFYKDYLDLDDLANQTRQINFFGPGDDNALSPAVSIPNNSRPFAAVVRVSAGSEVNEAPSAGQSSSFKLDLGTVNTSGSTILVTYTISGTLNNGLDVDTIVGIAAIPPGQQSVLIDVRAINDDRFENTQTLELNIIGVSDPRVQVDSATKATINIIDNDNVDVGANLSVTPSNPEGGSVTFTVTLDKVNHTGSDITFDINPSGGTAVASDYDFPAFTITVPRGLATGSLVVAFNEDDLFENSETLSATISNPSDPAILIITDTATTTIEDNDNAPGAYTASIRAVTNAQESGTIPGRFEVDLGVVNNTGGAITLFYSIAGNATSPDDYAALTGSVDVLDGQSTALIDVTGIVDDKLAEGDETIQLTLIGSSDSAIDVDGTPAEIIIIDDDHAPLVSDFEVTTLESSTGSETTYTFTKNDFATVFTDADGDSIASITINNAPSLGTLGFQGNAVTYPITVTEAQLDNGDLVFIADDNHDPEGLGANGQGYASIEYTASDGFNDSNTATVTVNITPQADAPNLSVDTSIDFSNRVVNGGFEDPDLNGGAFLSTNTLPDWTVSGSAEIHSTFHSTDTAFEGDNYIELDAELGLDTIFQDIATSGAGTFELSFAYSPRPGTAEATNTVEVYWDGQLIDTISQDGTGNTVPVWTTFTYQVTGNATSSVTRLEFKELSAQNDTFGGYLDNVQVIALSLENNPITLPIIAASLVDTDGSEILKLEISTIPIGAELSDGTNSFIAVSGHTIADITDWNLDTLVIIPPVDFVGDFSINVDATAFETGNGDAQTTTSTIDLSVNDNNDGINTVIPGANTAPQALDDFYSLLDTGDTQFNSVLQVAAADGFGSNDFDNDAGDRLYHEITQGPVNGTLIHDGQGGFSYVADNGFVGEDSFNYETQDAQGEMSQAKAYIYVYEADQTVQAGTDGVNDTLTGGNNRDVLYGLSGDDTLVGGAGDDFMRGGAGADTFKWNSGDEGSPENPAHDTIAHEDFELGTDVLDLQDLLQGESEATLSQYLTFAASAGDTTISVSSTANGPVTQTITLLGVDLTNGGTLSQSDIINNLLNGGSLNVDS